MILEVSVCRKRIMPAIVNLHEITGGKALLKNLPHYLQEVDRMIGEQKDVVLTGRAPVWLYLLVSHHLHGSVGALSYRSPPLDGDIMIFDHDPYR